MKENQTALKVGGITSSKVIRCPLWEASWRDFSPDVEDRDRQENTNMGVAIVKKLSKFQEVGLLQIRKSV